MCIRDRDKIVDEWNIELNLGYDHLLVGMSGGMDSSILLWMIAYHMDKNNLDGTIHAYSVNHEERPWQAYHAKKVLKYVKEEFPNVKFGKHFERTTPGCKYIESGNKLQWKACWELALSGETVATYNGVTLNPPNEIGEDIWKDNWVKRAMNRNFETIEHWKTIDGEEIHHNNQSYVERAGGEWIDSDWHYGEGVEHHEQVARDHNEYHIQHYPFCTQDKRVVLAFYKKYGQLVSLGSLTNSCEGAIWMRGNPKYSRPCHWCWWCIEKEWATSAIYHYNANDAMRNWPAFMKGYKFADKRPYLPNK